MLKPTSSYDSNKVYTIAITNHQKAELLQSEIDLTRPLAPDEIAGQTLATLISTGTELNSAYLTESSFPKQVGYAAVFRLDQVGAEVSGLKVGDIVFASGSHSSYQRQSAKNVVLLPAGLSAELAVFARIMGVSMTTLTTTSARPPAKVLVSGLGLVGHLAAKNFLAAGYQVYACDPVEARRQIAMTEGLDNILMQVPVESDELYGQFPLAIECSGHEQALLDAALAIRKGGEVVCIATPWRKFTDLSLHALHNAIFFNYAHIRSGWEWELPHHPQDFKHNSLFENYAGALRWLQEGRVSVSNIYTKYHPADAQNAYQDLLHKRNNRLAVVFDWTDIASEGKLVNPQTKVESQTDRSDLQQNLLYIQTSNTALTSNIHGMSMLIAGKIVEPELPFIYQTPLEAIQDGWRIIQFPNTSLMMDECRTYGLGCEFILEKYGVSL